MSKILAFLKTLWYHRSIVSEKQQAYDTLWAKNVELEAAVSTLAHALVYAATPTPEPVVENLKPVRIMRRTYTQEARVFERVHSARFREMDAARQRKEAAQANR
jgi:hypothetical protein